MKWKTKKTTCIFVFQKYGKIWSVSLEHFIKHKPLISEEWWSTTYKVWKVQIVKDSWGLTFNITFDLKKIDVSRNLFDAAPKCEKYNHYPLPAKTLDSFTVYFLWFLLKRITFEEDWNVFPIYLKNQIHLNTV